MNHEQFFFEIELNILPLFTSIQGMIVLVYTHEVISRAIDLNICRRKPFKVDLIDISKLKFTAAILFCLVHQLLTP